MSSQRIETLQQETCTNNFWIIYKHSDRCLTSRKAKQQIQAFKKTISGVAIYEIEVHNERAVSNRVTQYFEVTHQSPQCILFKGGKIKKVMNHFEITARQLHHHIAGGRNNYIG